MLGILTATKGETVFESSYDEAKELVYMFYYSMDREDKVSILETLKRHLDEHLTTTST